MGEWVKVFLVVRLPKNWKEYPAESKAWGRPGGVTGLVWLVCSGELPVAYRSGRLQSLQEEWSVLWILSSGKTPFFLIRESLVSSTCLVHTLLDEWIHEGMSECRDGSLVAPGRADQLIQEGLRKGSSEEILERPVAKFKTVAARVRCRRSPLVTKWPGETL